MARHWSRRMMSWGLKASGKAVCRGPSFQSGRWGSASIYEVYSCAAPHTLLPPCLPSQGRWWRFLLLTSVFWSMHACQNSNTLKIPDNALFFENKWGLVWSASINSLPLFCSQKSLCTSILCYLHNRTKRYVEAFCCVSNDVGGSMLTLNCSMVWTFYDPNLRAFQEEEICKVDLIEYYF